MSGLSVSLLGPFQAAFDGRALNSFRTSKVQALFVYLLVEAAERPGQGVGREQVMALLWPEMPRKSAQENLRQTLYQLRKMIPEVTGAGSDMVPLVLSDRQEIWVNPEARYDLDAAVFISLVEAGGPGELAAAVALYRGAFLADFYLEDSNEFETWAAAWRGRLQRQALDALERLASHHLERGEAGEAAAYARRALEIDTLRESAHRQLMVALGRMGKRAEALRQYERCRALLQEELDAAPSSKTEAVARAVRRGDGYGTDRGRLPASETPLIGREAELAEVRGLLLDGARLVSIVGPGGMGKTRLALEVARSIESADSSQRVANTVDRVHSIKRVSFVNLAPLSEAEEVAPTVARALEPDFGEADRETLRRQLLDYLQGKDLLLVLDNFEHLLEEATLLKEILRAAPGVKLLVTSRERLKLQAEHLYPLSGLAYSQWTTPVEAARDPAVRLFLQQARRMRPAFRLHSEHLQPLQEIVSLTEGMPLALILAAGWVKVLGPADIAAELARSLDFLEATHRDVPARQRSMRAVFRATWERLDEREGAIFAALSVFRGGFALEAAQAITGAMPGDLMQLADRSLVTRVEGGRYEVHELLRQFAGERLEEGGKAKAVREAHSAYYCNFLKEREGNLKGPRVDEATAEITADLDNIWEAWTWASDNLKGTLLQKAAGGLAIYFSRQNRLTVGPARFLDAFERMSDAAEASPRTRATLLLWPSLWLSLNPATRRQGETHARQALAFLDEVTQAGEDVRAERAWALMALGNNVRDDHEMALQYLHASLALFSELSLPWEMGWVHERLGATYVTAADYLQARGHYRQGQRLFAEVGDRLYSLHEKLMLAYSGALVGRLQEAETALRDGLPLLQESGDRASLAWAHMRLGEVQIYAGRFEEALPLLALSGAPQTTWSNPFIHSNSRLLSNWATLHLGRYREAQEEAATLLASSRQKEVNYYVGLTSLVLGCAALALGEGNEAGGHLRESVTAFRAIDQRDELGWARAGLGYVALHDSDVSTARTHLVKALRYVPEHKHYACALMVLPAVALLFAEVGEKERGVELYALAGRHGFVANSRWFEDVAGRNLAAVAESLPAEVTANARARAEEQDLWETAGALLQVLTDMRL